MQVEDVKGQDEDAQPLPSPTSGDQKNRLAGKAGREIKDKLTELFIPNKLKSRSPSDGLGSVEQQTASSDERVKRKKESLPSYGRLHWADGYMPRGKAEISDACRQAFTASCHLLLECTTFPVYLSEEETLALYTEMFDHSGQQIQIQSLFRPLWFCYIWYH